VYNWGRRHAPTTSGGLLTVRTCLTAGMPFAETASRHGHDVDTMLWFYTGTVLGETERGNELLDEFYGSFQR